MRRLFLLTLGLVLSLSVFAGGPQIKFEKKVIDVGTVPIHHKVVGEFKFKNVGDKKLVIYMVKPG